MKHIVSGIFFLFIINLQIPAQQNWAGIPCSVVNPGDNFIRMFVDSLHNEIILSSDFGYSICNTTYKGLVAYNGNTFHNLDFGVNTHNPNPMVGGQSVIESTTYGNKTVIGGYFQSVGSSTLFSKSIAMWNGAVWDTFPKHVFTNNLSFSGGGFYGFLRHEGKLLMYGGFDTIGNVVAKNIAAFDGNSFSALQPLPVDENYNITKVIRYKNKLIATGTFYTLPSFNFYRLAQFDGTSWAEVGNGVRGGLSSVWDMQIYNDTLYIAGSFPKSAGNVGNYIMKWDGSQLHDAGFGDFCNYGAIIRLLNFNNKLYAFGNFSCAANQKAFGVAYYENGNWTVPQDSIENWGIRGAVVYNDAIYISGGFKSINGDTTIAKFAKLLCPDFVAAGGCISGLKETNDNLSFKVFPNPATGKLFIEYDPSILIDRLTLINPIGQEIHSLSKPQRKQEIDISTLAAGVYCLKIQTPAGQKVFKIVKE